MRLFFSFITFWRLAFVCGGMFFSVCASAVFEGVPIIGEKFTFDIQWSGDADLQNDLIDVIRTQRKQSQEFGSINAVRNAARFDRDIIAQWLDSEGFFAHRVTSTVGEKDIVHVVDTGPRYIIKSLQVHFPPGVAVPPISALPVSEGKALRAAAVLRGQELLKNYVLEKHCLYHVEVSYNAEINHGTREAFLTYRLKDSPAVLFGVVQIVGMKQVEVDYLKNYVTFQSGECFKRKEIELTRLQLLQSNLLSRVDIMIAEPEGGRVIVTFNVAERSHRTFKAGVGYDSDTDFGTTFGWQHRNLFHNGERFDIDSHFNDIHRDVSLELLKPHFKQKNQTLTLTSTIAEDTPDGYAYTFGGVGASLNRPLSKKWAAGLGLNLEFSRDRRENEKSDYALFSIPMSLDFNPSKQVLDPVNGWVLHLQGQPFWDLYNTKIQFIKTSFALSAYFSGRSLPWRPSLALRWAIGSISGESLDQIPSAHRYYVGGGGSVRGYRYQSVGELEDRDDANNVPVGGLSFAETAVELRLRITEHWGGAVFIDGGYAYPGERPEFGQDFLWGAGIGIRYFTSFAPIRFDVATPLHKRTDARGAYIDNDVQIYISIGQAF